jgi:fluoroacetyl-CoA thioesterase
MFIKMKNVFSTGDQKQYKMTVKPGDVAAFHGKVVHEVCSTFTLAREAEWATRQFVLDMIDSDEEGVGTFINVNHKGPAFVGEEIVFTGKVESIQGNELVCTFQAAVGERMIAEGKTGQKIFKKEKLAVRFAKVRHQA